MTADLTSLLWSATDLLRADFKQAEYYRVLLPFTFLRRLECLARPRQPSILASVQGTDSFLADVTGLVNDMAVFRSLEFEQVVQRLDDARLLPDLAARFAAIDLTRAVVPDEDMGDVFSDLVRHGTDLFAHVAGEFSTPPDVAALLAGLLFAPDTERLSRQTARVRLYDPVCGAGGTFAAASEALRGGAQLDAFGQDINAHSYALCRMNLAMRGIDAAGVWRSATRSLVIATLGRRSTTCWLIRLSEWNGPGWRSRSSRKRRRELPADSVRDCPGAPTRLYCSSSTWLPTCDRRSWAAPEWPSFSPRAPNTWVQRARASPKSADG